MPNNTAKSTTAVAWWRSLGPGLLVTAAFVGPGTVTKATSAGASYGYALLWAVVFSVLAAIVFQEMAARLGLVTGSGLGEAIRSRFSAPVLRFAAVSLVVAAIAVGNAAYQTGNLIGAANGVKAVVGGSANIWVLVISGCALGLLWLGRFRLVCNALIVLVILMSGSFLLSAVIVRPNLWELAKGSAVPHVPQGSWQDVVALIGTTVVPYNLFLHASAAARLKNLGQPLPLALRLIRLDTVFSLVLGGLVTAAIIVTARTAYYAAGTEFTDLAKAASQLEPVLGSLAHFCFCAGLFAAGLTSAITAPLAAAYATAGCLNWPAELRDRRFRMVIVAIVAVGASCAVMFGKSPITAIHFAQLANGVLLPLVAVFLLAAMNSRKLLPSHTNGWLSNSAAIIVVSVVAALGLRSVISVLTAVGW